MKCSFFILIKALPLVLLCGCAHHPLNEHVLIQINIPNEPYPGTRTKVITHNVQQDRDIFYRLYESTRQKGLFNLGEFQKANNAIEVISVSFSGDAIEDPKTFHIYKNREGAWLTVGSGHLDIIDHPGGWVKYKYSSKSINQLRKWYEKNIPLEDRKR